MIIGDKLKAIRKDKGLSQGDLEKRTGLLRCYISRVENGHTVPAIETLEKMARAMEIPMYQLFYDGKKAPIMPLMKSKEDDWGHSGQDAQTFSRFRWRLERINTADQRLLLHLANKMARRNEARKLTKSGDEVG